MTNTPSNDVQFERESGEIVTIRIMGQLFGMPIGRVQDVFMLDEVTEVPLAAPEIVGVLNLRGRIMTAISMRRRLQLPVREEPENAMAVGIEYRGESYGLIIDEIGDVLHLDSSTFEANPANLDPRWAGVASGVHRLEKELLVLLDVDRVLDFMPQSSAA